MAIKLHPYINTLRSLVESAPKEQVDKLGMFEEKNFNDVKLNIPEKAIEGFKKISSDLGVKYDGCSFTHWETEEGYGLGGPNINSDGKNVIVNWGKQKSTLEGKISGRFVTNNLTIKDGTYTMSIPIQLAFTTDKEREEALAVLVESDEWSEVLPILAKRIDILTPKEGLWDLGQAKGKVIDLDLKESKTNDSHYWVLHVETKDRVFGLFLTSEAAVKKGSKLRLLPAKKMVEIDDKEYAVSSFMKWADFPLGEELEVVDIQEKTGAIKGKQALLRDGTLVDLNTQFENWLLRLEPDISTDSPVLVTPVSKKKAGQGYKVKLNITHKKANLADYLSGNEGFVKPHDEDEVSDKVIPNEPKAEEDEDVDPDETVEMPSLLATSSEAAPADDKPENDVSGEDDDWFDD